MGLLDNLERRTDVVMADVQRMLDHEGGALEAVRCIGLIRKQALIMCDKHTAKYLERREHGCTCLGVQREGAHIWHR